MQSRERRRRGVLPPHARSLVDGGTARADRLLRTAVFTTVCVVLSACGHTMATGVTPSWGAVSGGVLLVAGLVVPMAGRRRPVAFSAGMLAVLQVGLHTFFTVTVPSGSMAGMPMEAVHPHLTMGPAEHAWAMVPSAPMVCGHVVAAVGAAWMLRGADAALERICEPAAPCVWLVLSALHALVCAAGKARSTLSAVGRLLRSASRWWESLRAGTGRIDAMAGAVTRRGPPAPGDVIAV